MNNTVTFETAKRLKEAAFPQPEQILFGQHYYDDEGRLGIVISDNDDYLAVKFWGALSTYVSTEFDLSGCFFAPTATDILRELGKDYELSFFEESWFVCEDSFAPCTEHDNPAEACALAWLKLHEK
jgi:hypothetical protein